MRTAADFIAGRVVRTPVIRSPILDGIAGSELWLKAENLQHIGAFKARGALTAVGRLSEAERERGVLTYSSGNHAQAVALAAKTYGVPCHEVGLTLLGVASALTLWSGWNYFASYFGWRGEGAAEPPPAP